MNYDTLLGYSVSLLILGILFQLIEKKPETLYKAEDWFMKVVVGIISICFAISLVVTTFYLTERECKQGLDGCEMTIQEHPDFVRK